MEPLDQIYSVRVDGHELVQITLSPAEYGTQRGRDEVRSKIAVTYEIPRHYLRLVCLSENKYRYDREKGKNVRI